MYMPGEKAIGQAGQRGNEVPTSGNTRTPGQPGRIPELFGNEVETSEPPGKSGCQQRQVCPQPPPPSPPMPILAQHGLRVSLSSRAPYWGLVHRPL